MTRLKFLAATLVAATMFGTPAMARESHVSSRHLAVNSNAGATPGAQAIGQRDRFRRYEGQDVWGHWGSYYGPMIPSIP
jgi:hypothetical protein